MPDMAIKNGKDGRLEVDPEAAKVVKMIFRMAAEGTSFADITRELNRQAIATCDEQKLSRGDQVQFQRFDTIKKKHWSPTTVSANRPGMRVYIWNQNLGQNTLQYAYGP